MKAFSYAYWVLIGVTCPFFYLGAVVLWAITLPFDRRQVALHLYSCAWAVLYVRLNPLWRLRTTGREHLPWRGGAVLVANHASLVDILVLFDLFRPFKWVSKAENFKIPFVGWNMRLNGYVSLVRGDADSARAVLRRCDELVRAGSPVLFFPEGTRTSDGRLMAFRPGAFDVAMVTGVPVVPIAVHGTGRALPKHGMVLREHVDAHVEVLEPLDPGAFASAGDLRDAARELILAALDRG